jgi:hypothetical protein
MWAFSIWLGETLRWLPGARRGFPPSREGRAAVPGHLTGEETIVTVRFSAEG